MRKFNAFFLPKWAKKTHKKDFPRLGVVAAAWVVICGLLAACAGLPGITPQPTDTLTPTATLTPTDTATIVWFPPTSTATPQPTPAEPVPPTAEPRPGLGDVVLQDTFSTNAGWLTGALEGGTAELGNHSLSLVIPDGAVTLTSQLNEAVPDNYYLEITATANLCRGKDSYGLLYRSDGGLNAYHWILTCDGQMRMERWRTSEAAVVQDWNYWGEGGAPLSVRLGLWLYRDEMRFFVNGVYLFSVHDPVLTGSHIGVFTKSTGQNALSVSFSNLVIRNITGYVPSPIPSPTVYVTLTNTRAPTWTPVH
jgi:hypothetical protein